MEAASSDERQPLLAGSADPPGLGSAAGLNSPAFLLDYGDGDARLGASTGGASSSSGNSSNSSNNAAAAVAWPLSVVGRCLLSLTSSQLILSLILTFFFHLLHQGEEEEWLTLVRTTFQTDIVHSGGAVLAILAASAIAMFVCTSSASTESKCFFPLVLVSALSIGWSALLRMSQVHHLEIRCPVDVGLPPELSMPGRAGSCDEDALFADVFKLWRSTPIGLFAVFRRCLLRPWIFTLGIDRDMLVGYRAWQVRELSVGSAFWFFALSHLTLSVYVVTTRTTWTRLFQGCWFMLWFGIFVTIGGTYVAWVATCEPMQWFWGFLAAPCWKLVGGHSAVDFEECAALFILTWFGLRSLYLSVHTWVEGLVARQKCEETLRRALAQPFRADLEKGFGAGFDQAPPLQPQTAPTAAPCKAGVGGETSPVADAAEPKTVDGDNREDGDGGDDGDADADVDAAASPAASVAGGGVGGGGGGGDGGGGAAATVAASGLLSSSSSAGEAVDKVVDSTAIFEDGSSQDVSTAAGTALLVEDSDTGCDLATSSSALPSDALDDVTRLEDPSAVFHKKRAARTLEARRAALAHLCRQYYADEHGGEEMLADSFFLTVRREYLLEDTWEAMVERPIMELLAPNVAVMFEHEDGLDAGGLTKDWFDSVGRALADASETDSGLLCLAPDGTWMPRAAKSFSSSTASGSDQTADEDRHLPFLALGRFAALAVLSGRTLPLSFTLTICKYLLRMSVNMDDVRRLDPVFFKQRVEAVLRQGGVEAMNEALGTPLTFTAPPSASMGEVRRQQDGQEDEEEELMPGGTEILVSEENKVQYIRLLCEAYLCGGVRREIQCLIQGFWDIIPVEALQDLEIGPGELSVLISGLQELSTSDWLVHSTNTSMDHQVHTWFWEVLEELTAEQKSLLLHFVTGSSRLPPGGFRALRPRFSVDITPGPTPEHLPHAHTCINKLILHEYTSKEQLRRKLLMALSTEGFAFA